MEVLNYLCLLIDLESVRCVCALEHAHTCVGTHMCHRACVEAKRHLVGVSSFIPPYGSQELNWGSPACAASTVTFRAVSPAHDSGS